MLNGSLLNATLLNGTTEVVDPIISEDFACLFADGIIIADVYDSLKAELLFTMLDAHTFVAASGMSNDLFFRVTERQSINSLVQFAIQAPIADTVGLVESIFSRRVAIMLMVEVLAITSPSAVSVELLARSLETLIATDSLRSLVRAVFTDGFAVTETATARALARALAQELVNLATTSTRLVLHGTFRSADSFVSVDTVRWATQALAMDGLSLESLSEAQARSFLLAAELLAMTAGPGFMAEITGRSADTMVFIDALRQLANIIMSESLALADTSQAAAVWKALLTEVLSMRDGISLSIQTLGALVDNLAAHDALRFISQILVEDGLDISTLTDVQAANVLRAIEWLTMTSPSRLAVEVLNRMSDPASFGDSLKYLFDVLAQDEAALSGDIESTLTMTGRMQELIALRADPAVQTTLLGALADRIATTDAVHYAARFFIEDGIHLESLTVEQTTQIVIAAELLGIGASAAVQVDLLARLVEHIAALDSMEYAVGLSASDAVLFTELLQSAVEQFLAAPDTLALVEAVHNSLIVIGTGLDTLIDVDQFSANLAVALRAPENLVFIGKLPFAEGDYQAWVMNTDTLGVTSYSNFPFNSLYEHNGTTYGVTETGLYELTGDDDEGTPIDVIIRTGMLDFGNLSRKMMPRCYLYVQSDGQLTLKTISDNHGTRSEHWYTVETRAGESMQAHKMRLGKGLQFITAAIELTNVDGSSLDLRGIEAVPVMLRRI